MSISPEPASRRPALGVLLLVALAATVLTALVLATRQRPLRAAETARSLLPVGIDEWQRRMEDGAGAPVAAVELESVAAELLAALERRLDGIAREIDPRATWRQIFVRLQEDHPADAAAVLALYRQELEAVREFVAAHRLVPLPEDEPVVVEARNPMIRGAFPLALYVEGRLGVVIAGRRKGEGGDLRNHCRVCIPPLVGHETYPGHHVAFRLTGTARLSGQPVDPFFHEGWGLYAELLLLEHGYYRSPERALGAWRNVLLRVLRAWIDPRLHRGALTPGRALALYRQRLLLPAAAASTELRGHLTHPGIKASYLVGALQILQIREHWTAEDPGGDLASFHRRLLRRVAAWPEIARRELGIELGGIDGSASRLCGLSDPAAE